MFRSNKWIGFSFMILGLGVIIWWLYLLVNGQMPELETTPVYALLHVTAEITMGVCMLVGGIGILSGASWARKTTFVAVGMMLYAVVNAAGYYAQTKETPMVVMFGTLFVLGTLYVFFQNPARDRLKA